MQGEDFIGALKRKFEVDTDQALASALGVSAQTLTNWRKGSMTPTKVAAAIQKTRAVAVKKTAEETIQQMISPLVEMFPLEVVDSLHGAKFELFPSDKEDKPQRRELRELLNRTHGIYIFYDSRGRALYVGKAKAKDGSLWARMRMSFNNKKDKAKLIRVEHPGRSNKFVPACEQSRKMRRNSNLTLADLAAFVTVYEVAEAMIDEIEALLIRSFANDLLNIKMENFMAKRSNNKAAAVA